MGRIDIAIIGMGCVLPHANSVGQYWNNVVSDDCYFSKMPERLWRLDNFHSEDRARADKSYTTTGAFLQGFEFPFNEYRLPPNTMRGVDMAQLVTLEATREALQDAGIKPRSEALANAITLVGASGVDAFAHSTVFLRRHRYFKRLSAALLARGVPAAQVEELHSQFDAELASRGHDWNPAIAAVGAIPSSISNRVAQVFGVGGFNMTLDAACASSFVALDVACQALDAGDTRLAIAGGADLGTNPAIYVGFSRVDGLSTSGTSNPFDHTADGLVIGEGVGIVVLKRLEDALADGDRVRAVVRGIGTSSDGHGQAIYTPSASGRSKALRAALKNAEIEPRDIQYLEAHATSTVVGDANEYDAISKVYGGDRGGRGPLLLGSVKQQIGHLKAAAGMAGLLKTILAMEHGTFPHMPRFKKLTPRVEYPSDSLRIPSTTSPWQPHADGSRLAAVTASGFGGVNYHVVLEQSQTYQAPAERPELSREIAIVGVSCRVAGADSADTFWQNITSGRDVFTPADAEELGWQDHLDQGPENEQITTRKLSRIGDLKFNLLRHKIFPTAVSQIAPTQFLALDLADSLLQEYGLPLKDPKKIGVSLGAMHDDFFPDIFDPMAIDEYIDAIRKCPAFEGFDPEALEPAITEAAEEMRAASPQVTEHTLPGWMTNVIAGRIANKLNLQGPNFTVDSACSSGLAALIPAAYQLMYGQVDMMISGGLNQQLSDVFTAGVCSLGAVAEETARPFDAEGQGFLIGEGGVFFLLKRLRDARRDGDSILGIIDAVGGSSEADTKSMVAPTEEAVRRSIRDALVKTSIEPEEIGVVDTHGSANKLSDIVEARALAAELRPNGSGQPVQMTAIKSHIGHIYGGSGAASMLSTLMALRDQTAPTIRNLENVRPEIQPLLEQVQPRLGTEPLPPGTRAGAVNSLGLGGANYFAVVSQDSQVDLPPPGPSGGPDDLTGGGLPVQGLTTGGVTLRADDPMADSTFVCLVEDPDDLASALGRAATLSPIPQFISEGNAVTARLTATFGEEEELRGKLTKALQLLEGGHEITPLESQGVFFSRVAPQGDREKLALCLPGQGTHYITMGQHLYGEDPSFRAVLDRIDALSRRELNFDLLEAIHGDPDDVALAEKLATLEGAQLSLFAVEVAMGRVLLSLGVEPDVMIGHSFGEISALTLAGVWDLETAFKVVQARIQAGKSMSANGDSPYRMMSLICSPEQRDALLRMAGERVVLTNINAPERFVLAGEKEAVQVTMDLAESFGAEVRLLPIAAAFHSRFMEAAREPFRQALVRIPCSPPKIPILSTITGEYIDPATVTSESLAEHLSNQLITPLNIPREVTRLHDDGVRHFLEVGPGWSMTKMIGAILKTKPHRAAPCLHPKVGDHETYRRARAFLMALGHLESAARRQDLPGLFTPDFVEYMKEHEPSVVALIDEVYQRYQGKVRGDYGVERRAASSAGQSAPRWTAASSPSATEPPAPAVSKGNGHRRASEAGEGHSAGVGVWVDRLRQELVEITGYPQEMLEDNLDLEADLGVDSVQQAEIWVTLTSTFSLPDSKRPTRARTIAQLAELLNDLSGDGEDGDEPPLAEDEAAVPAQEPGDAGTARITEWTESVREKLVTITGYPEEMLEDNLDLEADLGVDSVQQAEIWMSLTKSAGLDGEKRPRAIRTISQLALELSRLESEGAPEADAQEEGGEAPAQEEPELDGDPARTRLFVNSAAPLPVAEQRHVPCKGLLVIVASGDGEDAKLERAFAEQGIDTVLKTSAELIALKPGPLEALLADRDTLVYAAHGEALRSAPPAGDDLRELLNREVDSLYALFSALHPVLSKLPLRVVVPLAQDGRLGCGGASPGSLLGSFPAGFIRALAQELRGCRFSLLDCGDADWAEVLPARIQLETPNLELGLSPFGPMTPNLAPVEPGEERSVPLERGDLVLVAGGARGIVLECMLALAKRTGCSLALTGRTVAADGSPDWLRTPPDQIDGVIRAMELDLVKKEGMNLGEAKRAAARARSQWELARNMDRLKAEGIEARYFTCDVADPEAFSALVRELSGERPIRAVVIGAGVQRSMLMPELTMEAVHLTLDTKLSPIFSLLSALPWDGLRLLLGFGSVTGLLGNAGQTDYGLANDLLAVMVEQLGREHPHLMVQTVEWTAWTGTGMVTEQEAKRFAENGLFPIDIPTGVALFMGALFGCQQSRIAAFNAGAGMGAGRQLTPEYPMTPRPRQRLLTQEDPPALHLSVDRDLFLGEHLVNEAPVVPGAFITEIFSEAAATLSPGLTPAQVIFRRPLLLRDPELALEVVRQDDTLLLMPRDRPELAPQSMANLSFATCIPAEDRPLDASWLPLPAGGAVGLREKASGNSPSFYDHLADNFSAALNTGPIFQGIQQAVELDRRFYGLVTLTDAALALLSTPGDFIINPVMADMAVQVASAWGVTTHGALAIPAELEALHVGGPSSSRDAIVICERLDHSAEESLVNIAVRQPNGKLIFALEGLLLKTIARL